MMQIIGKRDQDTYAVKLAEGFYATVDTAADGRAIGLAADPDVFFRFGNYPTPNPGEITPKVEQDIKRCLVRYPVTYGGEAARKAYRSKYGEDYPITQDQVNATPSEIVADINRFIKLGIRKVSSEIRIPVQ